METLTAAAIATLLVTKMVEKLGETLGEKAPELGSKIWEQVSELKALLKGKSPETAAVLEAAENAPLLIESNPDVFGLPVLTEQVEDLAKGYSEIAELIQVLDAEVRPQLPAEFQQKLVKQVMFKGVQGKNVKAEGLKQEADSSATEVSQQMGMGIEAQEDVTFTNSSQKA
ncbi:hypothetical protein PN466_01980 [Roseofilum reptotaenium CS-1145]|uniref:Uncharacterized protein n=1 Tax=Roseofilum reptotaenium AO1-A TaxID=1925591 RepID=A0A1L9QN14_9CYAN|nr:hypothetical protein [Roseofilum reptotaenium]MDB9515728.1 hypothetical protein [Roseofilum reptotaenium CS-1145]OJJ24073.1 hypothetical protein BI308_18520 [Roseofilum reptotaenium AO1-A]